ncbi:MAG: S8 family peptidase [Candidatus Eisenbacteria bacterium]|nr:S8 family peptidase [Candidatus Eisenbacteria bacterium]
MPQPSSRLPIIRLLLATLVVFALAASSCSKQLPTAVTPPPTGGPDEFATQVVVLLAPGVSPDSVAIAYGATVHEFDSESGLAALLPASGQTAIELAALLALDPRVVTSEQNGALVPAETRQKSFAFDDGLGSLQTTVEQPAADSLGLAVAHGVSTGAGVKVAVLDTGIDPTHPMIAGRIAASADFLNPANTTATDLSDGVDNDGNGAIDEAYGHGTHVAGIVMLTAPDAQLLVARVLDADGRGDVLAVAAGIRWALRNGARVINLSLGTLKGSDAIQDALEEAENANVVVVASAGNWGSDTPEEYPARSSHALAVAATDVTGQPASFTSYGGFVALAAPGIAVRSAYPGSAYRLWSGTSMSAPFVAGTAALLVSLHPGWGSEEVMDRLALTARPLRGLSVPQREKMGDGMLDTRAALLVDQVAGPALARSAAPPGTRRSR